MAKLLGIIANRLLNWAYFWALNYSFSLQEFPKREIKEESWNYL